MPRDEYGQSHAVSLARKSHDFGRAGRIPRHQPLATPRCSFYEDRIKTANFLGPHGEIAPLAVQTVVTGNRSVVSDKWLVARRARASSTRH